MFGLGSKEVVILAVVLVLLFGTKKIPELARSIADTIRYFKGSLSNKEKEDVKDSDEVPNKKR